jgi:hypothetical protein
VCGKRKREKKGMREKEGDSSSSRAEKNSKWFEGQSRLEPRPLPCGYLIRRNSGCGWLMI